MPAEAALGVGRPGGERIPGRLPGAGPADAGGGGGHSRGDRRGPTRSQAGAQTRRPELRDAAALHLRRFALSFNTNRNSLNRNIPKKCLEFSFLITLTCFFECVFVDFPSLARSHGALGLDLVQLRGVFVHLIDQF